ncbi:triple tyrosine motif-containing protein [Microscilla marina]|nr:triple tyrosine motif-containing protein [Microscilla marina]
MIHQKNEELYSWYDTPFRRLPSYEIRKLLVHNNKLYIATSKGLLRYDPNKKKNYHIQYPTLIKVSNMNTTYLPPRVRLPYQQNQVTFEYSAPFYEAPDKTLFSYRLMGFDKEWSDWGKDTKKEYTNLPEGNYTFQVKAKNVYGTESTVASYTFTILPPWYRTWWAYILYGLAGFALFIGGSYTYNHYRSKQLYRRNQLLEQEVTERTEEILAQKEEITQQADMLKTANEGLKQANEKLHQVNQIIKKESDDKVGIYAQEVTDAMIRLEQVREVFESSGAETAKRMLNVELNTTGKLTVIRQKVSDAFPEFVVKLDKALANKQINKTIWQVAHCLKLGMKPKEIAEILPVQARSVSTFGSKLRKLGLLTKEG